VFTAWIPDQNRLGNDFLRRHKEWLSKNFVLQGLVVSQESKKSEWLSKKRQMQGAQLSRNEAYSGTPQ
jgi:hypothetical protein